MKSFFSLQRTPTPLARLAKLTSISLLSFLLSACGGGGGGGSTASTTATITSISPVGMVASGTARALSITGTNFASGMTVTVSNSLGGTYTTGTVTIQTSNLITTNVTIATAPTDKFVTVTVKSSTGTTLASTTLGVASVNKTLAADIQPIFTTYCASCHGSSGNLSLSSGNSASNLIQTSSSGCSGRLRVKAGDSRITSSFLIDKISSTTPCSGTKMTGSGMGLGTTEIDDIIEWVAGGAN